MKRTLAWGCLVALCLTACQQQMPQAPVTIVAPPKDPLVGKWQDAAGEGMEFAADGEMTFVSGNAAPWKAKYKRLTEDQIEFDLGPTVKDGFKATVVLKVDTLDVTAHYTEHRPGGLWPVEHQTSWTRVESFTRQFEWSDEIKSKLVGRWANPKATDWTTYDLFEDGFLTRSRAESDHLNGVDYHQAAMGKWQARPEGGPYLQWTFPDVKEVQTVYAFLRGDELVICDDQFPLSLFGGHREEYFPTIPLLRTVGVYERSGAPGSEVKPLRADVLTAYQLSAEYGADREAADKKYKGKEVTVVGIIQNEGNVFGGNRFEKDGKTFFKSVQESKITLCTGGRSNVLCRFNFTSIRAENEEPDAKELARLRLHEGRLIAVKGTCVGIARDEGGSFQLGGGDFIRFDQCDLAVERKTESKKAKGQ